ncbi:MULTISPECIES: putative Ig domain-containing protein [Pseudomonas]|uniref:Mannuronan epimerase n=1 Tax=Pseudomonas quercus TaxID=2722792 RepID=A0ABX0YEK6_9PSED|nr:MULTISPECIES: putative Ig domain-containing protein [Pseudomonas]MBF7142928.1 putative Ig domain-containing protein [Pseudomonas sp. LY10J]NJP01476.1 mannuronan epimerase [Pseudomonas quercus]
MIFNVKDFGAVGDGVTDDTAAMQAAIDAASAAGGGTVFVPSGTFIVSAGEEPSDGCLMLKSNVHMEGEGAGLTTVKVADGSNTKITGVIRSAYGEETHDFGLSNLTIDGNRDNTTGKIDGWFNGYIPGKDGQDTNVTLSGVEIKDCSGYGFDPHEQTVNMLIENCVSHGNGLDGFVADYMIDTKYVNNVAYDNDRHGFNIVTSTHDFTMTGNVAYGNGAGGIVVQRGSENIPSPYNVTIEGGAVYDNGAEGVLVKLSSGVTVTGVDIHDNGSAGVRIYGSSDVTVTGNTLTNNGLKAPVPEVIIQSYDDTNGVSGKFFPGSDNNVLNNTITGGANSTYGVAERNEDGTDRNTIVGNDITNTTKGSTLAYGDGTYVGDTLPTLTVEGTAGNDTLTGTARDELFLAGAGKDTVSAGAGDDILVGGAGADKLTGGAGADTFRYTALTDSYRTANATFSDQITDFDVTQDTLDLADLGFKGLGDGYNGTLLVQYNANTGRTYLKNYDADASGNRFELSLNGNLANTLKADNFVFQRVINGTSGSDSLMGTSGADTLNGLAGADSINGGAGADRINGGAGADTLTGGAGADTFVYTSRLDSYRNYNTGGDTVTDLITDFAVGSDKIDLAALGITGLGDGRNGTVYLTLNSAGTKTYIKSLDADASGNRFEIALNGNYLNNLTAASFVFTTVAPVNHAPVVATPLVDKTASENTPFFYAIPATSFSDADKDTLTYSAKLADGSSLPSWLTFDAATRTFSGTPGDTDSGTFNVTVTAADGKGGTVDDTFNLAVQDMPATGSIINGTTGKDTLTGTNGNDQLFGLDGADTLNGGAGNDVLVGGAGADKLTGGAGADVFRFTALTDSYRTATASASDLITDFDVAADKIDLSALGFIGLGDGLNGTLNISYSSSSNRTYIKERDADANGNRFELALQGNYLNTLKASNFVFSTDSLPLNHAPAVTDPLLDSTATENTPFSYTLSQSAFTDSDGDALTFTATLQDGTPLPSWLTFDAATRTFSGTPDDDAAGVYNFMVTATDTKGASASDVFALTVANAPPVTVTGTENAETLNGTGREDLILGLGGDDTLNGNNGNDVLDGGSGRDTLTGGAGADTFRYTALSDSYRDYDAGGITATDTVTDFTVGVDKIDVSALGFLGLGDGTNHTLYTTTSNGKTYIKSAEADSEGNRFEIALTGDYSGTLTASDFIFAERPQQDILFLPTLGQSNARLLRMTEDDGESGITEMVKDLSKYTDYDVRSQFTDADGNGVDVAVGGSTVSGLSTGTPEELRLSWWLTDTNEPGPALLRAVGLLQEQLASLKAVDNVTMGIIWGQGEEGAQEIGRAADPVAYAAQYKADTLKVFDYLHAQLGDFKVYIMETGHYDDNAARVRGYDDAKIASIQSGVVAVRAMQEAMAAERSDVELAVDYTDLPLRQEADPVTYPDDVWHLHEESAEIVGQRLADYIAGDVGFQGNTTDNRTSQDVYDEVASQKGGYILGTDQDDTLVGSGWNDTLDGDLGADNMTGGDGKDVYIVDNELDTVTETNAEASQIDTVKSSVSWTLGANVEYLVLTGYSAINGTGNELRNFLTGNDAANVLDGGAGADNMTGGNGNDTYYVDNVDDAVVEKSGEGSGIDTVYSSLATFTLGSNLENMVINSDGAADAVGNGLDNILFAGSGNNLLDGRAGTDTASYVFAAAGVNIALNTSAQQDTLGSGLDTLKSIENVVGSRFADNLTGNSYANVLDGGDGDDVLVGGAGDDTLIGGAGTDSLTGGTGADTYVFKALADLGLGDLRDVISGFKTTEGDKLDFTGIDADASTAAHENFTFIGSQAFSSTNAAGQLRLENGILYGSVNSDASAEFEVSLVGVKELQQSDFVA